MNRYPLWKYILIGIVLIIGLVYTLPNFYGESPAVQVTSGKATVKVTEQTLSQVETALANANLKPNGLFFEQGAQQNTIACVLIRLRLKSSFVRAKLLRRRSIPIRRIRAISWL